MMIGTLTASRHRTMLHGVVAALAIAAFAPAVDAQNLKIGVINVARLLEQAPQSQAVNAKLQDEFAPRQREILAKRQELQTQSDTFTRDAPVMGEEERLNLERQIRDGQRELQRAENQYLEDLNIRRNEELGALQREVLQRVQAYASAEKYDLVVADALYYSNAIDITNAVLAALQQGGGQAAPRSGGQQSAPSSNRDRESRR
jgi:outer membrane protein